MSHWLVIDRLGWMMDGPFDTEEAALDSDAGRSHGRTCWVDDDGLIYDRPPE